MSTSAILNNQPSVEEKLPKIERHVKRHVVSYTDDKALLVIKLTGMPFESLPDDMIVNRFDSRNRVFASMAKDKGNRLAIWTTLKREKVSFDSRFQFKSGFMREFAKQYLKRFELGSYFENNFYVSLVLKHEGIEEGANELEELGDQVIKSFKAYDPEYLTTYVSNGMLFSQTYEFLGTLINGFKEPQPVYADPAHETIPSSWLHWGYDLQELRGADATRYATNWDLKGFPDSTKWGMFDKILSQPAEFTLTQSYQCYSMSAAKKAIEAQINKLESVKDKAGHQLDELQQALGYLSTGELAFGEYHCALTVFGETKVKAVENGSTLTSVLLNECSAKFLKSALSAPFTYLSHVPGAKNKPRPMLKSTRNLAASFGMHNFSTGKSEGNPIGDGSAIMPLQSISSSLYSFNFHYTKDGENNLGDKIAGHTLILGATGVGKTTLETALVGFLERFDNKIFALDKDEGLKIFIHALDGVYYSLKAGVRTGLAPFQLPDTAANRQFLYGLVKTCAQDRDGKVSDEEANQIKFAVDTVMGLDVEYRRFSRLVENISGGGGNSLRERLAKWCESENGEHAWALDNVDDNMSVIEQRMVGFDVSDFLREGYEPTEPVLAYLFHLKNMMQTKGGLLATIIEEFYVPAMYPSTQKMMFDVLKTGRKRDEFMIMASQSPEDAINSPIFAAIRDQTPTKILMPNPSAEFASYLRVGLTIKEFTELKALDPNSRTFLIKQGNQSCFAKLDLYGMDDQIAVLSGNTENVAIFNEIIERVGTNSRDWMPEFQRLRTGKKTQLKDVEPA